MKKYIVLFIFIFFNQNIVYADLLNNVSWYRVVDAEGNFFETEQFQSSLEPLFWQDELEVNFDDPDSLTKQLFDEYLPVVYEKGQFTYMRTEFGENEFDPHLLYEVYDFDFYPAARHELAMFGFQNEGRFAMFAFNSDDSWGEIKNFYSLRYDEKAFNQGQFNKLMEMIPEEFLSMIPGFFMQYSDGQKRNVYLFIIEDDDQSNCFVIITEKWI